MQKQSGKHEHGEKCGHLRIKHGDHIDYLDHDHLQHVIGRKIEEHRIEVTAKNPDHCRQQSCNHTKEQLKNSPKIPHGDHFDYLFEGKLHHVHGDHCDDHGTIEIVH